MKTSVTWAAAAFALCAFPVPLFGESGTSPQAGKPSCEPSGVITPICGVQEPEDLEIAPDKRHLLATLTAGFARHTTGVGFGVIDLETRRMRRLEPTFAPQAGWGDSTCKAPREIGPHGFHLSRRRDGRWQLLAVNHAGRESMEFYELTGSGDGYGLIWRGCVVKGEGGNFNDVAATPDGFVASVPDPRNPGGAQGGSPTPAPPGHVVEWTLKGGLRPISGTESSYPNGVHASADGSTIYWVAAGTSEIAKLDRATGKVTRQAVPFLPDNISVRADGQLILGGIPHPEGFFACARLRPARFCPADYAVAAVDPATLAVKPITKGPTGLMAGVTVAVQQGDRVYLGFATDNRVVEVNVFAPPSNLAAWTARPGPMSILTEQATRAAYVAPHGFPLSLPIRPGMATGVTQPRPIAAAPPAVGTPLETRPPTDPSQRPAFAGQTRAKYVKTRTAIQSKIVARGLNRPWGLGFLPDGAILITEKPGTMRIVSQSGQVGEPIAGVPPVFFLGDAGLFDVEIDPQFAENRTIYLCFAGYRPEGNALMVVRAQLSPDRTRLESIVQLLTMPAFNNMTHYGGRMLLGPDGKLYIGASERMDDATRLLAQSPASPHGKVLRINTDGSIPQDNPYAQVKGAEPRIWSIGHRDVQGFAVDPATKKMWISDHGPRGGDEVDVLEPGLNYGWPIVAYGGEYTGQKISNGRTAWPGTEQPDYYWDPAIAPSGIAFYAGTQIPEWRGNLFVAALVGRHLSRLVIKAGRIVGEERLLLDQGQRVRDVVAGPDGALWVITDDPDGRLIRLSASRG